MSLQVLVVGEHQRWAPMHFGLGDSLQILGHERIPDTQHGGHAIRARVGHREMCPQQAHCRAGDGAHLPELLRRGRGAQRGGVPRQRDHEFIGNQPQCACRSRSADRDGGIEHGVRVRPGGIVTHQIGDHLLRVGQGGTTVRQIPVHREEGVARTWRRHHLGGGVETVEPHLFAGCSAAVPVA